MSLFDLSGRIIVLTGGLGQLGSVWTDALLAAGARVAVLDARAKNGIGGPIVQNQAGPANLLHVRCEVDKSRDVRGALAQIVNTWHDVPHGLINAAAVDVPPTNNPLTHDDGSFEQYGEEAWDRMFEINVKGTWLMCQTFGACMAEAGRGSIVNIGSIYGEVSPDQRLYEGLTEKPWVKPLAYSATKGCLPAMGRWLATYWAKRGVRVNTLVCGGVAGAQSDEFKRRYSERVPMGRMASASDYVGALVYLLSDASRYQTGSVLTVDGGWTAW